MGKTERSRTHESTRATSEFQHFAAVRDCGLLTPKALAQLQLCANIKSCMKHYAKILFSIFAMMICAIGFAADQPACKTSGKNCPMNSGGACNCGKSCDC